MQSTLFALSFHFLQNAALPVLGVVTYAWVRGLIAPWPQAPRELLEGAFCALLAVLCMSAPLVLMPGVYLDARNAVIGLATVFGGPFAGLITAAAAGAYRLWLGGVGVLGGVVIAAAVYAVAFAFVLWLRHRKQVCGFRHLALLGVGIGLSMLLGLLVEPPAVAAQILSDAYPGLAIVPGAFLVMGGIVLLFERARAAEQNLQKRQVALQRQQRALMEIVRANAFMEGSLSFTEAVRSITEAAGEVLKVEYAQVWQIDETAAVAQCVDEWVRSAGRHGNAPDANLLQVRELLADLAAHPAIVVEDAMHDARFASRRDLVAARGVESGILAGIYLGKRVLGVVGFLHVGSPRQWTADDLGFVRSVANVIALMLVTSRHREALAALDLVGDAIYVEREDSRVIYANRAALALAGLPDTVMPSYGTAAAFPHAPAPLEAGSDLHEIAWGCSGGPKELELHRSKLPGGGVITMIEDVTQKKAAQRDRERLQNQLQQASKMEAIGQLASGIAHDFNNLLGAVIGFARFLEQDLAADTPQRRFAERILSACHRGRELVSQIMAFTRARALETRPVDLRTVLRESRELLAGSLPPTTRLLVEPSRTPLVVEANQSQLQQIAVNLCLNAHDALGGQAGEISVRLSRVRPGDPDYRRTLLVGMLDPAQSYARLDVSDTGSGIRPENLARIFEPFFTTKERGRGTGLGLAVVHGIVATYEGACAVDSEPGAGTRFSVYLPVVLTKAIEAAAATQARAPRGRERVLIVDDDIDITDMLAIGLERLGYETAALNDPREALDIFAEAPAEWDAVITDQLMPGMHGVALAEKLKALRPELVVILCTGLDDGSVGPSAKSRGVDAFLLKPVEPEQIAAAIRQLTPS